MKPVVSVVEDHDIFRETLCTVVSASDEWALDGVAASGEEALELLEHHHPDVLLIDLSLPGMSGLDLVAVVGDRWPDIRCLILSGHAQASYARQALERGAYGYVLKEAPGSLRDALREVIGGRRYVSGALIDAGADAAADPGDDA